VFNRFVYIVLHLPDIMLFGCPFVNEEFEYQPLFGDNR